MLRPMVVCGGWGCRFALWNLVAPLVRRVPFSLVQTPPPLLPFPSSVGSKKPTSQDGGHPSSAAGTVCWTGSFLQRLFLVGKDPSSSPSAWAPPGGLRAPP